jgi:uncharacterized protein YjbI with pentapeptide repeats
VSGADQKMPEQKTEASLGSRFKLKRVDWSKEGSILKIFRGRHLPGSTFSRPTFFRANVFQANVFRAYFTLGKCSVGRILPGKLHSGQITFDRMSLRANNFHQANVVRKIVTQGKNLRKNAKSKIVEI